MSTTTPFRVLVVDDDAFVRLVTVRALQQGGLYCEEASDGKKALEKLRDGNIDVVVCDLRMPEMNGESLAIELLAIKERPAIIVLSGGLEPRLASELLARGVDYIIAKPPKFDFLVCKVRALAERQRLLQLETEHACGVVGGPLSSQDSSLFPEKR